MAVASTKSRPFWGRQSFKKQFRWFKANRCLSAALARRSSLASVHTGGEAICLLLVVVVVDDRNESDCWFGDGWRR